MMNDSISIEFERALEAICTQEQLRAIEMGDAEAAQRLWSEIDALGFSGALLPEGLGGAELSLTDCCDLLLACGRNGVPHPFGETMVARALLGIAGLQAHINDEAIALAKGRVQQDGSIICREVSGALLAERVLVDIGDTWLLLPKASATERSSALRSHASASLQWASSSQAIAEMPVADTGASTWCALIHSAVMAGAMERVLAMTVGYASERRQFGKAIGQFQAIQQELAVMAEQAASAMMGARMACSGSGLSPSPLLAATAKLRASEAAGIVAPAAHAVHGAIGITEELLLGVFTTRLHELRSTGLTERASADLLGAALEKSNLGFIDFVASSLAPVAVTEV